MKTLFKLFVLVAAVVSFSSCATLFSPTKYAVSLNTTPNGAGVTIENKAGKVVFEGTTPSTVKLKAAAGYMQREEYTITFTKDGYVKKVVHLSAELEGWYIGNIFLGGLPGWLIIDPLSGAMFKIAEEDREIHETLQVCDINNLPSGVNPEDLIRIN